VGLDGEPVMRMSAWLDLKRLDRELLKLLKDN
jgi:hypothetical protein